MKSKGQEKPEVIQAIGNNEYYINYNIVEKEESFEWDYVRVMGYPNSQSLISAMIRDKYSDNDVEALVSNYKSYELGITTNNKYVEEYEEFLRYRVQVKAIVAEIFK